MTRPLDLAVLVKQIPAFDAMHLGSDGRLQRSGLPLEMNPYCRRAVAQAVALAEARPGSTITVFTLGPPSADDALREAIAWAGQHGVAARGVLVSDPAFAGSDTLATARALAAVLGARGPFDLVLMGRNSVDSETGQVGPQLAQLLDLPFLTGVRHLELGDDDCLDARCEHDDGMLHARVFLPLVMSCAERLIDPAKVDPAGRAEVSPFAIERLGAAQVGEGPWGADASPTWVGEVREMPVTRRAERWPDAPLAEQVARAVAVMAEQGAFAGGHPATPPMVPAREGAGASATGVERAVVAVVVEPDRPGATRELLGAAASAAVHTGAHVVAIVVGDEGQVDAPALASWGADAAVVLVGTNVEEDVAAAVARWALEHDPWAILTTSTSWGREVGGRVAAALGAGLTGDAIELEVVGDRLVAWKPAFGGQALAAIHASSPVQMVTVRPGVLSSPVPRAPHDIPVVARPLAARGRIEAVARTRDDALDVLAEADAVIGVGRGVAPEEYGALEPLRTVLGAELGATRKVTDKGWMPHARQIGITGRSIAPRVFVSIGANGKFNHMVGVRSAGVILAVNSDPEAVVFDVADAGVIGDWHEVVPLLAEAIAVRRSAGS